MGNLYREDILAEAVNEVGDDVGRVYASNTIGSILGAWLPGFVLLPLVFSFASFRDGVRSLIRLSCMLTGLVAIRCDRGDNRDQTGIDRIEDDLWGNRNHVTHEAEVNGLAVDNGTTAGAG